MDDKEFVAKAVVGETADGRSSKEFSVITDDKEFSVITDDKEFVAKAVVGEAAADGRTGEEPSVIMDDKEFVAKAVVGETVGGGQMSLYEDDAAKK